MGFILSLLILGLGILLLFIPKSITYKLTYILSIFLLMYKLVEYTLYGLNFDITKIPVEYSTITYFLFSVTVIFQMNKLKPLAAFMGFLSGFSYLIAFMFLSQNYYAHNGVFITNMALINHSLVFLGGLMLMRDEKFHLLDKKKILFFTTIYIIYVLLVSRYVTFTQSYIFILILLGGDLLKILTSSAYPSSYDYLMYFLILLLLYQVVIHLFIGLNHLLNKIRLGESHEHSI